MLFLTTQLIAALTCGNRLLYFSIFCPSNLDYKIAILAISVVSIVVVVMIYYTSSFFPHRPSVEGVDLFGIDEIYPTKEA
jgi:hypothetical protein